MSRRQLRKAVVDHVSDSFFYILKRSSLLKPGAGATELLYKKLGQIDQVVNISKSAGRALWCVGATPCALPGSRVR